MQWSKDFIYLSRTLAPPTHNRERVHQPDQQVIPGIARALLQQQEDVPHDRMHPHGNGRDVRVDRKQWRRHGAKRAELGPDLAHVALGLVQHRREQRVVEVRIDKEIADQPHGAGGVARDEDASVLDLVRGGVDLCGVHVGRGEHDLTERKRIRVPPRGEQHNLLRPLDHDDIVEQIPAPWAQPGDHRLAVAGVELSASHVGRIGSANHQSVLDQHGSYQAVRGDEHARARSAGVGGDKAAEAHEITRRKHFGFGFQWKIVYIQKNLIEKKIA